MSRKKVEVEAKTHRQDRVLGDAPSLGRVARAGDSHKGEDSMDGPSPYEDDEPEPGEWLLKLGMISALLIGLIVGGGLIYFTVVRKLSTGLTIQAGSERSPDKAPVSEDAQQDSMIGEQDALDLVRRGLAVRFASKVTDQFLYTKTLEPPEVVTFLMGLAERDGLVDRVEWLEPLEKDGKMIGRVRVISREGESEQTRVAYLLRNTEGEWKIDFESFVSQTQPAWDRVLGGDIP